MIIGNGDIAKALKGHDRRGFIFFASGVSNSLETDRDKFAREISLLWEQNLNKHIIYFSSLGVFNRHELYFKHKRNMENLVRSLFFEYTIIRLGNISWGKNPHTFINAYKIKPYSIKNEYRYVISKQEFLYWIDLIPKWNCEMNIPGERLKVRDALKKYGNT